MTAVPFALLAGHKYMNLTTFRKSGQPVPTPVWFAQEGDQIYVVTFATSGKVKRIRANPRVQLTPSDSRGKPLGETVEAHARILDPSAQEAAHRALAKKYGVMYWMFAGFWKLQRQTPVFLEITPVS